MCKLKDIASVIRTKNSGPYELTMDILFKDEAYYRMVANAGIINKELISQLYQVPLEHVLDIICFQEAKAIKATIVRPRPSGDIGERDVYGAQQHVPLMNLQIDLDKIRKEE